MGSLFSLCCPIFFGSKNNEFDPDRDIVIQARDENERRMDSFELRFSNRTSVVNQNVDLNPEGPSLPVDPPSKVPNNVKLNERKNLPAADSTTSTSAKVLNDAKSFEADHKKVCQVTSSVPEIRVTPANRKIGQNCSSDSSESEQEIEPTHLQVPKDEDYEEEEEFEDDIDEEMVERYLKESSTLSLPRLENIDEEGSVSDSNSEVGDSTEKSFYISKIEDTNKEEKRLAGLSRSWSFDSNRELVERNISLSEDEDEKENLQDILYQEIVDRFGPDPEFDENLERTIKRTTLVRQVAKEEVESLMLEYEIPSRDDSDEIEDSFVMVRNSEEDQPVETDVPLPEFIDAGARQSFREKQKFFDSRDQQNFEPPKDTISVELVPRQARHRSSFHNLIIIPIKKET